MVVEKVICWKNIIYLWLEYNDHLNSVNRYYHLEKSTKLWGRKGEIP